MLSERVEHDDPMDPPAGDHRAERLQKWLGHRRHDQQDDQRPDRQQQPLLDADPRRFLRMAARRNRMAAQGTSRNLRRFRRWITIGHRAAASP